MEHRCTAMPKPDDDQRHFSQEAQLVIAVIGYGIPLAGIVLLAIYIIQHC